MTFTIISESGGRIVSKQEAMATFSSYAQIASEHPGRPVLVNPTTIIEATT